jgi:hypothetical protein
MAPRRRSWNTGGSGARCCIDRATVDIESPGGSFRVQFEVAPGEQEYVINLNRLWFWNALSRTSPRITAEDGAAQAVMEYRRERGPVLY